MEKLGPVNTSDYSDGPAHFFQGHTCRPLWVECTPMTSNFLSILYGLHLRTAYKIIGIVSKSNVFEIDANRYRWKYRYPYWRKSASSYIIYVSGDMKLDNQAPIYDTSVAKLIPDYLNILHTIAISHSCKFNLSYIPARSYTHNIRPPIHLVALTHAKYFRLYHPTSIT